MNQELQHELAHFLRWINYALSKVLKPVDFTREDELVKDMTNQVIEAIQNLPPPPEQNN